MVSLGVKIGLGIGGFVLLLILVVILLVYFGSPKSPKSPKDTDSSASPAGDTGQTPPAGDTGQTPPAGDTGQTTPPVNTGTYSLTSGKLIPVYDSPGKVWVSNLLDVEECKRHALAGDPLNANQPYPSFNWLTQTSRDRCLLHKITKNNAGSVLDRAQWDYYEYEPTG